MKAQGEYSTLGTSNIDYGGPLTMGERLKDKVAIVTGAGTGLGAAIATVFAKEGASVVVNDVDIEAAKEVVKNMPEFLHLLIDSSLCYL